MKFFDNLFKPRQLPAWWLRFTAAYPAIPNIIAITGLAWICFSLAPIISEPEQQGQGHFVETVKTIFKSESLSYVATSLRTTYHSWFPDEIRIWVSDLFGNITLYLVIPFLLILEYLFPCKSSQPIIGKGLIQDVIWFAASVPAKILVLGAISQFLLTLYNSYLGFLTIGSATAWPAYLQIITAILVGEFLFWFHHFARHKIRILWLFHAVHHSQKELNVFTEDRNHIIDKFVGPVLTFIPFYMFQVPNLYAVAVVGLYISIHSRFVHANVKINLGWLGWIFTSPQFHRVHHSCEVQHLDKNFGGFISLFDHLFGTACPSRTAYPETGIEDSRFPTEDKVRVWQLPQNWLVQVLYPFVKLFELKSISGSFNLFRDRFRIGEGQNDAKTEDINKSESP